jgi:hypothetical protein
MDMTKTTQIYKKKPVPFVSRLIREVSDIAIAESGMVKEKVRSARKESNLNHWGQSIIKQNDIPLHHRILSIQHKNLSFFKAKPTMPNCGLDKSLHIRSLQSPPLSSQKIRTSILESKTCLMRNMV